MCNTMNHDIFLGLNLNIIRETICTVSEDFKIIQYRTLYNNIKKLCNKFEIQFSENIHTLNKLW